MAFWPERCLVFLVAVYLGSKFSLLPTCRREPERSRDKRTGKMSEGVRTEALGRAHPDHHAWVDNVANLAVDGARLAVEHEDSLTGRGDHVSAEHARAADGPIGVPPARTAWVDGAAGACDNLDLAILQVHQQDVPLGGRARVQVIAVARARREKGRVADLQRRLHVEQEPETCKQAVLATCLGVQSFC